MRDLPSPGDLADLVRLPSVLSVPGDAFLGAATSGGRPPGLAATTAASSCLYLAGMALNDYADRRVDAKERPGRPIPSGRVTPGFALRLAGGLTAAGLGLAYAAGGRRALGVAVPLAATVWAYDLSVKKTSWGPLAMATARFLDVMMGAGALGARGSWPAAGIVGAHTFLITTVSRREVEGGTKNLALGALAGTAAVTAASAALASRKPASGRRVEGGGTLAAALLGVHAASMGAAEIKAYREPVAANLQRVVGTGVLGLMPLEAGMLAAAGRTWKAAALTAGWFLARRLARRRPVT